MALTRNNGDYLRWSAKSLEDLLTIKGVQDGRFTDQLFKGSNLSVLVDLLAYINESNLFYLNHAASESMLSEAQYYENINRLVKLLNYFPNGYLTSSVSVTLSTTDDNPLNAGTYYFPRYLTFDAVESTTDESGFPISYTLVDDYYVSYLGNNEVNSASSPILYNGRWKFYPTVFNSAGSPSESFTMNVNNTASQTIYVAHPYIDVYIKSNITQTFEKWNRVDNLYDSSDAISKDYEVRVDENKNYTIKFGDGIYGRKLKENDQIYILFLQTNGAAGKLNSGEFAPNPSVIVEGLTESFIYKSLFGNSTDSDIATIKDPLQYFIATRESVSTEPKDFETPDEIRANAPIWFRAQGKLVTQREFEYYIKSNFSGTNEVHDVVAMNNTEYMNEFLAWLYDLGKLSSELVYYGYKFADSCNFNNVYLWIKSSNNANVPISISSKKVIQDKVGNLKPLTSEVIPLDPFLVSFTPYVYSTSITTPSWSELSSETFGSDYYFEIERDRGSLITTEGIKRKVTDYIIDFFNVTNNSLGQNVNLGDLQSNIKAISGVKSIHTIYHPSYSPKAIRREPGLWMAYWTPLLARGTDFNVVNNSILLKRFQFPFLFNSASIGDKIRIVSENFKINAFEY